MADSDFSVYARIQADTSNFEKGMKNAQTSASNLSKSFGNLSKVITKALSFVGVVFSAKAIADFGKTSAQSATQAIKQFKILDNTVKATGADAWTSTKQLEGLAKELSNQTNYSVTELENMESVLLGFRNITDDTFSEASEAILDMATVMGMDLKSAAQTVGKALDDPIKGLDSLRRQGFQFTDEQKEELAQLVKNGEQIKAQKIILNELAQSYGGAAKAGQDSFAKQRHAMENLKDGLGGKLIPVLQVFAEENAKVLDALREKIEQMDFSKAVNVVTNLKNIFTKRFEEIKQRVVVAKDSIVDFLKRFNFGPVVNILDTLIGHLVETVKMFREMQVLNFGSLKEGLIELSNSEAFEKFTIFFNAIIDVSHGILEEVKKTWPEIRDAIVNVIINIWDKIKEFFEKVDNALNGSGNSLHLWADLFWKELDNIYRIAQDLLKGVTHLLKGDWATAWEYAKLAVLRVADGTLDAISTIANGMPKIINKIIDEWNRVLGWINKGLKKLNKDPIDLVPEFKSVDLSDVTGVTDKIEEVEKKIQELTGAAADNGIDHLDKLSGRWKGFTSNALGEISALTEGAEEGAEKTGDSVTTTADKVENVVQTTIAKISEWDEKLLQQRAEGLKEYSDEYHQIQMQLLQYEREKSLASDESDDDKLKISKYYNTLLEKEDKRYFDAKLSRTKSVTAKIISVTVQSMKKVYEVTKNIFSKVAEVTKQTFSTIINVSQNVFGKFKELIEYNFDEGLEKILEFEDGVLTFFVETLPKLPGYISSVLQSIGVLLDNIFGNMDLSKIISDVFQSLPAVVDKVTGLFTELFSNLSTAINTNMGNIISGIGNSVLTIAEAFPDVINQIFSVIGKLLEESQKYLENRKEDIKNAIVNIITSIVENLPETITNMLSVLNEVFDIVLGTVEELMPKILSEVEPILSNIFTTLGTWVIKSLPVILNAIIGLVNALIDSLPAIIETLLKMLPQIIQAIMDALPKLLGETLPNLITILIELVPDIIKAALEAVVILVKNFPQIVSSIITGLAKVFNDVDWWKFVCDVFGAFGNMINKFFENFSWENVGKSFQNMWNTIVEVTKAPINAIIRMINAMIDGLNKISIKIPDWVPALGGKTLGFNIAKIKELAVGTQNAYKGLTLVGEAGPELINFRGGEQVLNNHNTNKALSEMGNKSNVFNVTFNNTQDTTAFAMMTQLKQYQRNLAFNGVL